MDMFEIPKGHIRVFPIKDKKDRKKFYRFIENNYPSTKKTSFHCSCFPSNEIVTYKKCWNCYYKWIPMNYHRGFLEGNHDEWFSGDCPKCGQDNQWECEDGREGFGIKHISPNNVVAIGDYFKGYMEKRNIDEETEEMDIEEVENLDFYDIPVSKNIRKKQLGEYVGKYLISKYCEE